MKDFKHRKESLANLRNLHGEELAKEEADLIEQKFWLDFKRRSGQTEGVMTLRKVRRALARVKTLLRERRDNKEEGERS